jgi:hypothetical protein
MPGVGRIRGAADGGPLKGGAPRVVWQTLGADPRTVSARSAAQRLDEHARASHLVGNPLQVEIVQLIPILRAGRLLGWPEDPSQVADETSADEVARINAEGRICVQICVVAFARDPFTSRPMTGLQQILGWLDSWGIPRRWPAGPPASFPCGLTTRGNRRLWAQGGYFGASQVPDLSATGPGAVDIEQLIGRASQPGRAGQAERISQPERTERVGLAERAGAVPVPVGSRRGQDQPTAAGLRDLDGYFDRDEADTAGALSRVG